VTEQRNSPGCILIDCEHTIGGDEGIIMSTDVELSAPEQRKAISERYELLIAGVRETVHEITERIKPLTDELDLADPSAPGSSSPQH